LKIIVIGQAPAATVTGIDADAFGFYLNPKATFLSIYVGGQAAGATVAGTGASAIRNGAQPQKDILSSEV
jgi:hypothetical protein